MARLMTALEPSLLLTIIGKVPSKLNLDTVRVQLTNAQGSVFPSNGNWADTQQADIQARGKAPPNARESAIIAGQPSGNATAIVSGKGGSAGNAIVEIYQLP